MFDILVFTDVRCKVSKYQYTRKDMIAKNEQKRERATEREQERQRERESESTRYRERATERQRESERVKQRERERTFRCIIVSMVRKAHIKLTLSGESPWQSA